MISIVQLWKKFKNRFGRYGQLDQKMLGWKRYKHGEITSSPNGEELVYQINSIFLEIGNATSKLIAGATPVVIGGIYVWAIMLMGYPDLFRSTYLSEDSDLFIKIVGALAFIILPFVTILFVIFALIIIGQFIGYTDIPIRFDRKRRIVHQWTSLGVISIPWDNLVPVLQQARAAPYQMNMLYSMLLVEFDEVTGKPKYTRGMPHIFNLGSPALDQNAARGRYAYVERFMSIGPTILPQPKALLRHRPRWYEWFNSLFVIDMWTDPEQRKFYGGMRYVMILLGIIVLPMWFFIVLAQWTTRIPKWPPEITEIHQSDLDALAPLSSQATQAPRSTRKPVIRVNGELIDTNDSKS